MTWTTTLRYFSKDKIILAKDVLVRDNPVKKYYPFLNYEKMIEFMQKQPIKHFYEVLKDERKPYFDIEMYCEDTCDGDLNLMKNEFQKIFIDELILYFNKKLKKDLNLFSVNISDSSGFSSQKNKYKISFHVVLSGFKMSTMNMKLLHKDFLNHLKKTKSKLCDYGKLEQIIDRNVYKSNQLWRMVGSSKINEPDRIMSFVNNQELTKHLVGYFEGNEENIDLKHLEEKYVKKQYKIPKKIELNEGEKDEKDEMEQNNEFSSKRGDVEYVLFECINSERANDYHDWFVIGAALHNANSEWLDLYIKWSKQSYKYEKWTDNICCCSKMWKTFQDNSLERITCRTIYYMGRLDNQEKYNEYFSNKHQSITTKAHIPYVSYDEIQTTLFKRAYGFSELFTKLFKGRVVFSNKEWYIWDGDLWNTVNSEFIYSLIVHTFEVLLNRLKNYLKEQEDIDIKIMKNIDSTIQQLYNFDICKKVVTFLKTKEHLYQKSFVEELDCEQDILSVQNGIVDLKTGKLRQREPKDKCSFKINVEYNEHDCDMTFVHQFFMDLMSDDEEIVQFIQTFLGYSITGHVSEQKFSILNGVGSNGKSVLMKTLHMVLGKYFKVLDKNVLMDDKPRNTQDQLVALKGSRLAVCDESEANEKLYGSSVKNLTGGAPITCRAIYKEPITYQPTFQLMLLTNHLPKASAMDSALWRRLILIPFERQFLRESDPKYNKDNVNHKLMDTRIFEKIKEHKSNFLRWLVLGSIQWYQNGISNIPKKIHNVTHDYRLKNDRMYKFLKESCDINEEKDQEQYFCKIKDISEKLKQEGLKYQYETIKKMLSHHGYIFDVELQGFIGFRIKPHLVVNQQNSYNYDYL